MSRCDGTNPSVLPCSFIVFLLAFFVLSIQPALGQVSIAINDVSANEGNTMHTPHTTFTFTVSLSAASPGSVWASYMTVDDSATVADSDYVPESSSITFNPGETTKQITIDVHGDTKVESDETFIVTLVSASGATITDANGLGTIRNDDALPTLAINDVTAAEGNTMHSPHTSFTFTVSLSAASTDTVWASYGTSDGSATQADSDYVPESSSITFNPGETSKQLTIDVHGDTQEEPDETFTVTLLSVSNATIADANGVGTIVNDDSLPLISINDVSADEGNTMHTPHTPFTFTVSLSAASAGTVWASYGTADGSATVADSDYVPESSSITFNAGETSKQITIDVHGDTTVEPNETFLVTLVSVSGATIVDANGLGTIRNDDALSSLTVSDVTATEGNAAAKPFVFTVTLSASSAETVTVAYKTYDASATEAGSDYTGVSGTLTFTPGQTSKTVSVTVNGDTVSEADETFTVRLSSPVNATMTDSSGVGTIVNDDSSLPSITIDDVQGDEGNTGTRTFGFEVTLSAASAQTVTVQYATHDIGATDADNDYEPASGTLTFSPGQTSKSVSVTINGDTKSEADEAFAVTLSNPTNATIADATGAGTIGNDDPLPNMSINDVSSAEKNSGTKAFTFLVTLSAASGQPVGVQFATADGSATIVDNDYTAASGTLIFTSGTTSKTVSVTVNGDTKDESDETFVLHLSNAVGAALVDSDGVGTIMNDDAPSPTIAVDDVIDPEGDTGTRILGFEVTLSAASTQTVTVQYSTQDGTATDADNDYEPASGTLTFSPGQTSKGVSIAVNGDTKPEADEAFVVHLSSPTNATIADANGVGSITNDDALPTMSVSDMSMAEGNSGTKVFAFEVTLSAPSGQSVSVHYSTVNGTATTTNNDYAAASGTLTFTPGITSQTISVTVRGDTNNEADEAFLVALAGAVGATLVDASGIGTILNDDGPLPGLSVGDVTIAEGNSGSKMLVFAITLSAASSQTVAVDYATQDGLATDADNDYEPASGTKSLNPGQTSTEVAITINGDTKPEANETFRIHLSNPVNATINDTDGTGTITNDDSLPTLGISNASLEEGDSGDTVFNFTVTLSAASGQNVSVQYTTQDGSATTADNDYAAANGALTFSPGGTSQMVAISVKGDTKDEPNETFLVILSNPSGATLADPSGVGAILNDDNPSPILSIDDVVNTEGHSGTKTFVFEITLSNASADTVSVHCATQNGSATVADGDYVAASGTLTFSPGQTSKNLSVTVNGDAKAEADESFLVVLSNPTKATLGDAQGSGTITNDDTGPSLTVGDVSQNEGNTGSTSFVFTVFLSAPSGETVTVQYAAQNGTAVAGTDFVATSGHTLTFAPGDTAKQATISVLGDTQSEADETFRLLLSNPVHATIGDGTAIATVVNDDGVPSLAVGDVSSSEGDSGTKTFTFNVTLSSASSQTVTVQYSSQDNTAKNLDDDYEPVTGILTFSPGETSKAIAVTVNGDKRNEPNETFGLRLASPTNASLADANGLGTITNDDAQPQVRVEDVSQAEGQTGISNFLFEVTLSGASGQTVTVKCVATDGSATQADSDYQAASSTLTFNPGETSKTVSVVVNGDIRNEPNETFSLQLSSPVNASIADATGVGTIVNDDGQVVVSISDVSAAEGNSGTTAFSFTVSLSAAGAQTVEVGYATGDKTATVSDSDYVAASGTLTFNPGETSKPLVVTVNGDTRSEAQERFIVTLSNPVGAGIGDGTGVGLITDDDAAATLSINDVTGAEGNAGVTPFTFAVTLQPASGQSVTVHYAALPGSATLDDNDFAATQGILTFGPGATSKTITVSVNGDTKNEPLEQFTVVLSSAANAAIGDGTGLAGITNDDGLPSISVQGATANEGNEGTTPFQFTLNLSSPSAQLVTVDFAAADGTATTADFDYLAVSGTLTFAPGQTTATITVAVNGDTQNESNETFRVTLSNPVNATLASASANGRINNDDESATYFPFYQEHPGEYTGYAVANYNSEPVDLRFLAYGADGVPLPFARNPYLMQLAANEQTPKFGYELFQVDPATTQSGWIELSSSRPVGGIFMFLGQTQLDGTVASQTSYKRLFFTRISNGPNAFRGQAAVAYLSIANPHDTPITFSLQLLGPQGQTLVPAQSLNLPAKGMLYGSVAKLFGRPIGVSKGYVELEVTDGPGAVASELIQLPDCNTAIGLNASPFALTEALYSAQFARQDGLFTNVKLINTAKASRLVTMVAINNAGQQLAASTRRLAPGAALETDVENLFDLPTDTAVVGSLRVQADGPGVIGDVIFGQPGALRWAAALPLQRAGFRRAVFNQVANGLGYFTGLAVSNFTDRDADVQIAVYSIQGNLVAEGTIHLAAGIRDSQLLQEFLPQTAGQVGGWVLLTSTQPLIAQQLFALLDLTMMSAVPPVVVAAAAEEQ